MPVPERRRSTTTPDGSKASRPRWPGSLATTTRHVMWDPDTGGGFDGLMSTGVNLNQGTESTLALLATRQHAMGLLAAPR